MCWFGIKRNPPQTSLVEVSDSDELLLHGFGNLGGSGYLV